MVSTFWNVGDGRDVTSKKSCTEGYSKMENYDNVSIMLPKRTKENIKETGESVNSFINEAVVEKFERDEK